MRVVVCSDTCAVISECYSVIMKVLTLSGSFNGPLGVREILYALWSSSVK